MKNKQEKFYLSNIDDFLTPPETKAFAELTEFERQCIEKIIDINSEADRLKNEITSLLDLMLSEISKR